VAQLKWRAGLNEQDSWISVYFSLISARGCRVEQDEPGEGA
jgi:hypothetical protein